MQDQFYEKEEPLLNNIENTISNPLITFIITTFQRPALLKKAVESVLNQTYANFQICVYDNGDDDATEGVMQAFVKQDPRVKYHRHPKNIGMMANYQFGLSRVDTSFFSLLSDDDSLYSCFLETALEGFKKHPDAAFSACSIAAIDKNDNILTDPLSYWEREGRYNVPDGLVEMTSEKRKLPIPTGILFQHKHLENIQPDWSDDIRLMWDPDYLLQIVAQHPIVINKKICGSYLVHSEAFSAGFLIRMTKDPKRLLLEYMTAVDKVLQRLMNNVHIHPRIKSQVHHSFVASIRNEFCHYMDVLLSKNRFSDAKHFSETLDAFYGIDRRIAYRSMKASIMKHLPFLLISKQSIICTFRKSCRFGKNQLKKHFPFLLRFKRFCIRTNRKCMSLLRRH